jgi:exopolysaccharide production protein ExoZ
MQSKPHFGGLDLVRFFAANLVMIFHFGVVSRKLPISPNYGVVGSPDYPELALFDVGWVGVEIFFVLSGFVIAQSADGRSAYAFLRGRAGRLMPTIWICASITLVTVLFFKMQLLGPIFSSYLNTMVVYPNGPWISNVYWTLIVEIFFYGAVFVTLALDAFRFIEFVSAILIIFSSVYLVGVTVFGWDRIHVYFLAQHGCFFGLGVTIWLCHAKGVSGPRAFFMVLSFLFCLVEICFVGNGRLTGAEFWLAPLVWTISIAAICASVLLPAKGGEFTRMLGLMTYPLYLVHEKLGSGILRIAPLTGKWAALFFAVSVVMLIAFLVVKSERAIRVRLEAALDWLVQRTIPAKILWLLHRRTIPAVK